MKFHTGRKPNPRPNCRPCTHKLVSYPLHHCVAPSVMAVVLNSCYLVPCFKHLLSPFNDCPLCISFCMCYRSQQFFKCIHSTSGILNISSKSLLVSVYSISVIFYYYTALLYGRRNVINKWKVCMDEFMYGKMGKLVGWMADWQLDMEYR